MVLVAGAAVKHNRPLLDGRWDKHDTKDSANIADLICQGKFLYYEYPDPKMQDLRNLLALKRRLKKEEHGLQVRPQGRREVLFPKGLGESITDSKAIFLAVFLS